MPLPTFSPHPANDAWDETPSIDAVAVMWPVSSQRFRPHEGDCAFYARKPPIVKIFPALNGTMANPLCCSR